MFSPLLLPLYLFRTWPRQGGFCTTCLRMPSATPDVLASCVDRRSSSPSVSVARRGRRGARFIKRRVAFPGRSFLRLRLVEPWTAISILISGAIFSFVSCDRQLHDQRFLHNSGNRMAVRRARPFFRDLFLVVRSARRDQATSTNRGALLSVPAFLFVFLASHLADLCSSLFVSYLNMGTMQVCFASERR